MPRWGQRRGRHMGGGIRQAEGWPVRLGQAGVLVRVRAGSHQTAHLAWALGVSSELKPLIDPT